MIQRIGNKGRVHEMPHVFQKRHICLKRVPYVWKGPTCLKIKKIPYVLPLCCAFWSIFFPIYCKSPICGKLGPRMWLISGQYVSAAVVYSDHIILIFVLIKLSIALFLVPVSFCYFFTFCAVHIYSMAAYGNSMVYCTCCLPLVYSLMQWNWFSDVTDACNSGASSDHREPISPHHAVVVQIFSEHFALVQQIGEECNKSFAVFFLCHAAFAGWWHSKSPAEGNCYFGGNSTKERSGKLGWHPFYWYLD